jgi:hypothetical protein
MPEFVKVADAPNGSITSTIVQMLDAYGIAAFVRTGYGGQQEIWVTVQHALVARQLLEPRD